jgi:hypothetical protein
MSTLHTDPIKAVGQEIFELQLSATEEIEKLRAEVKKATNNHLETISADLQRALAFHEAVDGLSSSFARMSDDESVELALLRRLRETTDRMAMAKTFGSSQSAAAVEGRVAAFNRVSIELHHALRDILRSR